MLTDLQREFLELCLENEKKHGHKNIDNIIWRSVWVFAHGFRLPDRNSYGIQLPQSVINNICQSMVMPLLFGKKPGLLETTDLRTVLTWHNEDALESGKPDHAVDISQETVNQFTEFVNIMYKRKHRHILKFYLESPQLFERWYQILEKYSCTYREEIYIIWSLYTSKRIVITIDICRSISSSTPADQRGNPIMLQYLVLATHCYWISLVHSILDILPKMGVELTRPVRMLLYCYGFTSVVQSCDKIYIDKLKIILALLTKLGTPWQPVAVKDYLVKVGILLADEWPESRDVDNITHIYHFEYIQKIFGFSSGTQISPYIRARSGSCNIELVIAQFLILLKMNTRPYLGPLADETCIINFLSMESFDIDYALEELYRRYKKSSGRPYEDIELDRPFSDDLLWTRLRTGPDY